MEKKLIDNKMMNGDELNRNKNRRKTEQRKLPKIDLNISKIKNSKMKFSISPRRKKKINHGKNNPINSIKKIYNHKSQKQLLSSLIQKDISFQAPALRRNSLLLPFGKIDNNSLEYKRFSQESLQNKATKFLQKYNNKINGENTMNRNSIGNYKIPTNNYKLNQIEHSIQNKINNMKIQIEKQVKITQNKNTINTEIQKRKLESSPKLFPYRMDLFPVLFLSFLKTPLFLGFRISNINNKRESRKSSLIIIYF